LHVDIHYPSTNISIFGVTLHVSTFSAMVSM
jgi:hypothetical protein